MRQLMLQLVIILTGNYNFFNVLTMVLVLPLLDDSCYPSMFRPCTAPTKGEGEQ